MQDRSTLPIWLTIAALSLVTATLLLFGFAFRSLPPVVIDPAGPKVGDVQVKLTGAVIGRVPYHDTDPKAITEIELLQTHLAIINTSKTRRREAAGFSGLSGVASLRDDLGNDYAEIRLSNYGIPPRSRFVGRKLLYPEAAETDVILWELPVPRAERLYLTLDAGQLGGRGTMELSFSTRDIQRRR